jgi:hypothetical protein
MTRRRAVGPGGIEDVGGWWGLGHVLTSPQLFARDEDQIIPVARPDVHIPVVLCPTPRHHVRRGRASRDVSIDCSQALAWHAT